MSICGPSSSTMAEKRTNCGWDVEQARHRHYTLQWQPFFDTDGLWPLTDLATSFVARLQHHPTFDKCASPKKHLTDNDSILLSEV